MLLSTAYFVCGILVSASEYLVGFGDWTMIAIGREDIMVHCVTFTGNPTVSSWGPGTEAYPTVERTS